MKELSLTKKIIFTVILIILLLVFAEIIARVILNRNGAISVSEHKNKFEPYQNKPWADQYFKDEIECAEEKSNFKATTSSFTRYTIYDVGYPGCNTKTINYSGDRRKTWEPEYDSKKPGLKVYSVAFFGGSTIQGSGVPDDYTIPSAFSKLVNHSTSSVVYRIENFGVSGYTYTQALIKLTLFLREGKKFDYVIFYNGANDVDNAYEAGVVGAIYGEKTVENRIYGGFWGQTKETFKDQLNSCGLCRFIITFSRNTPFLKDHLTPVLVKARKFLLFKEAAKKSEDILPAFAEGIAKNYIDSHSLLDHLSKAYGFKYLDFWQPSLQYENGPIGGEKMYWSIDNRLTDEKLKTLYKLTLENVVAAKLNNFYDLSRALIGRKKAFYLDAVHISDEGNEAIAKRIYDTFEKKF